MSRFYSSLVSVFSFRDSVSRAVKQISPSSPEFLETRKESKKYCAPVGIILFGFCCASCSYASPAVDAKKAFRDELAARRAAIPFGVPDESIKNQIVSGTLKTPDGVSYQFTSDAGTMLYVTNTATGESYSYIMAPYLKTNAAGEPTIPPSNVDESSDAVVQAFRLGESGSVVETKYSAVNTKSSESFIDNQAGGAGTQIIISGFIDFRYGYGQSHALCCVSCGTYQICGQSVTSSCGSCGSSGPGVKYNDNP